MTTNVKEGSRYPAVATEEAERLFEFLKIRIYEIAHCCNIPAVIGEAVTANMLMYTCLNHLFIMIDDTGQKTWADYPAWVKELYYRASGSEQSNVDLFSGERVILL